MHTKKITFLNKSGEELSGKIELPLTQHPSQFALFAHCFTCTKNLIAVRNISRALTSVGYGVLRFDFTGLGESEGAFADTNFSHNVDDLIAAAVFLDKNYISPSLLVGHSLGGTAAIFAASSIASVKAIATIGAPSDPQHVQHLLQDTIDEIETKGEAVISLSGRPFKVKKQFLDDLKTKSLISFAENLRKPLLILHSPKDQIVGIENAEALYKAAHHPKSFVTLDRADHLLSDKVDSLYVGQVIGSWASRYIAMDTIEHPQSNHDVVASLDQKDGFTTQMKLGDHYVVADEPVKVGGANFGPTPYELVAAGLSACTAMTIQMYAKRKEWIIENVEVHTSYGKEYAKDCNECEKESAKIDTFKRAIRFTGSLDEKQITRLLQIADKCPVHKTLHSATQVITKVIS